METVTRRGIAVSDVHRTNEVNPRRARLVLGWVTVFGRVYDFGSNQPTRSTRLNRVPASVGGKGGNVTSAGWQVTLCDPIWHVSSRNGEASC